MCLFRGSISNAYDSLLCRFICLLYLGGAVFNAYDSLIKSLYCVLSAAWPGLTRQVLIKIALIFECNGAVKSKASYIDCKRLCAVQVSRA